MSVPAPVAPARMGPSRRRPIIQRRLPRPFQMFKPTLKMLNVEAVGHYAIQIDWSDGHNTGIYSFDHLRKICPCAECKGTTFP